MNVSKRLDKVEKIIGRELMVTDELIDEYSQWLELNPGNPTKENPDWDFSEWLDKTPAHLMPVFHAVLQEMFPHFKKRWVGY